MIKLVEFLCVDSCNSAEDFIILKRMKVRKNNMTQDVKIETELKRAFSILEWINLRYLFNNIGNKLWWKQSIMGIMDFGNA